MHLFLRRRHIITVETKENIYMKDTRLALFFNLRRHVIEVNTKENIYIKGCYIHIPR